MILTNESQHSEMQRDTLLSDGNYNKKTWVDKEIIYKEDLNTLEDISYKNRESILELSNKIITVDDNTVADNKTWSSSKIEDFVLTNDDVVWTEVSGENLSIDYTKEGHLREVEIWGNTIQNEEDLSDIQHLGELYVDDEGEPILDELGREQYKIEIESENTFNPYHSIKDSSPSNINGWSPSYCLNKPIASPIVMQIMIKSNILGRMSIKVGNVEQAQVLFRNLTLNTRYTYVYDDLNVLNNSSFYLRFADNTDILQSIENGDLNIKLAFDKNYQSHKTTILLPCQLMKVGDVCDRLYWDGEKEKYVVEKKVFKQLIKDKTTDNYSYNWFEESTKNPGYMMGGINVKNVRITNEVTKRVLGEGFDTNDFHLIGQSAAEVQQIGVDGWTNNIKISISIEHGSTKEEIWDYIYNNPFNIYYELAEYQLIETNITEQLKLPTYIDKTHIFVTGGIDGSIKAKAPIDGGNAILSLSQENKELREVNREQDELINTTMLATDEMFSLLEPLLVNKINNSDPDNNPLIKMYVAMVQRGLKDIEDISDKYRDQVRQLLTN